MKASGNLARSVREVVTKGAVDDGGAVVDRGGGWPWLLAGLEAHILQQSRFAEVVFGNVAGVMDTVPPTKKMQQLMCIDAQGRISQAANILAVQETIDPGDLAACGLLDNANWTLPVAGGALVDHMELHG
jgi:hypothetical protein